MLLIGCLVVDGVGVKGEKTFGFQPIGTVVKVVITQDGKKNFIHHDIQRQGFIEKTSYIEFRFKKFRVGGMTDGTSLGFWNIIVQRAK